MTVAPPSYRWERVVSEHDPHYGYSPRPEDPERLTLEELRALKARWYAEAEALGELAYLGDLGRLLGRSVNATYFHTEWEREDPGAGRVAVFVDGKGGYLTVEVDGEPVCSTHATERLFVPGPWLHTTRGAAAAVAQERTRLAQERATAALRALREEMGLEGPDEGTPQPSAPVGPSRSGAAARRYSTLARDGR